LETRVLVLDTPPKGAEVAVFTLLKRRSSTGGMPSDQPTASARDSQSSDAALVSVRLERAHVNLQGKITADPNVDLLVPLEGAPTLECGGFIALPDGRITQGQEWSVVEGDRPPMKWRAAGSEMVAGNHCIKLVGEQRSDDWDHPRGDR